MGEEDREVPYHAIGLTVSLYGLHALRPPGVQWAIDDAAQTMRPHDSAFDFTSYSFQSSKIMPLSEGGMLVTNNEELAARARSFSSLGYHMKPGQPRILPSEIKDPTYARHYSIGYNYRMSDLVAMKGLEWLKKVKAIPGLARIVEDDRIVDVAIRQRRKRAQRYLDVIEHAEWLTPQATPREHDYWTVAVACDEVEQRAELESLIVKHGGEQPYPAWRLSYNEPALRDEGCWCATAENLQPRLLQFQTNNQQSVFDNVDALAAAIEDMNG